MFRRSIVITTILLGGCGLMPYDDKSACRHNANYGKCTNVSGAYREAVTGESAGPSMSKEGTVVTPIANATDNEHWQTDHEIGQKRPTPGDVNATPASKPGVKAVEPVSDPYPTYRNLVLKKLVDLVEQPTTTPMVKQPTQARTLILSYTTQSELKPLFMPRYVYYMLDDYSWVLGDYREPSANGAFNPVFPGGR